MAKKRTRTAVAASAVVALAAIGATTLGVTSVAADSEPVSVPYVVAVHQGVPLERVVIKGQGSAGATKLDDLTLSDLADHAKGSGENYGDVVRQETIRAPFLAAVTRLADEFPDDYLASGLGDTPDSTPWITLADKPSGDVLAQIEKLPVDVEVRYGLPAGVNEVMRLQAEATQAIDDRVKKDDPNGRASSHINDGTGVVEIDYESSAVLSPSSIDAAVREARSAAKAGDGVVVSVIRAETPLLHARTVVHGGFQLSVSTTSTCTSGFTAKIPNSSSGVVTAKHCPDNLLYGTSAGVIQIDEIGPLHVDLQFHKIIAANGHSTDSQFFSHSGWRTLASKTTPSNGAPVCDYGVATGADGHNCDFNIDTINHCLPADTGETYCGLVYLTGDNTQDGDSGGPFYLGTSAYGTLSGGAVVNGTSRSIFTSINFVDTQLGLDLLYN